MKIESIHWNPYVCPLRGSRRPREGFWVNVRAARDAGGVGEAAPVPGVAAATIANVAGALERLAAPLRGLDTGEVVDRLEALAYRQAVSMDDGERAALAGITTAVLDLVARERDAPLASLLAASYATRVHVNALLSAERPAELACEARRLVETGRFRTLKIKVGARSRGLDVIRVRAAWQAVSNIPGLRLRVDANRAWSFGEAARFLEATGGVSLDYVEEPLADPDPDALAALRARSNVAVALDESIVTPADLARYDADAVGVVVIKLQRVGGLFAARALARACRRIGIRVVVTDSIETSVGRYAAVHAAAALAAEGEVAGLGGAFLMGEERAAHTANVVELTGPGLDTQAGSEP